MIKRKTLLTVTALILVLAAAAGTIIGLKLRKKPAESGTSPTVSDTSGEAVNNRNTAGRGELNLPVSACAVIFSPSDFENEDYAKEAAQSGFNTAVFNYSADDRKQILTEIVKASDTFEAKGIRISEKDANDDFSEFEGKADFIIIALDENSGSHIFLNESKEKFGSFYLGLEAPDPLEISDEIREIFESNTFDFIFVSQHHALIDEFESMLDSWTEFPADLWICFSTKGLNSFSAGDSTDFINILKGFEDYSRCRLIAFSSYSDISSARSAPALAVKNYIKDRETHLISKEFEITNYAGTDIVTDKPVINLRGTSSPLYELLCNGKKIQTAENGDFTVDIDLKRGENKVEFLHKGKTFTYNISYNITLIRSVSPSSEVTVPGSMEVDFSAVALDGSDVTLTFNGNTYKMQAVSDENDDDSEKISGFSTYKVSVKMPSGKSAQQKLGAFKVTARNNGITQSKSGATVTLSPAENVKIEKVRTTAARRSASTKAETQTSSQTQRTTEESLTVSETDIQSGISTRVSHGKNARTTRTTSAPRNRSSSESASEQTQGNNGGRLQRFSYSENYGLGKAKLAEITEDYVEVFPGGNLSPLSAPECTPFLKGTVDYITGTAVIDSDRYCFLNSGYKAPVTRKENSANGKVTFTNLKMIDGYVMPSNNINIVSCVTEGGKARIKLDMNRRVPFNARLTGQSYADNGFGRLCKVNTVDCKGIKFTFYDTVKITGSLDFTGSLLGKGSTSVSGDEAVLNIAFAKPGKFYGWHCEYDSQGFLVITIKSKPSSIKNYTIMIDAGHGGVDTGASCAVSSGTWNEKTLNFSIASKIKSMLEAEGASVIMTRSADGYMSLTARNEYVRKYHPDLFISVHCDAASSSGAYGTTAYYYRAFSQPLAKYVHESIVSAYRNSIYAGMNRSGVDRGALFGAYRVTRVEECPSILVEYGFVTEAVECRALQNATNRDILAKATVNGIKKYIENS